MSAEDQLFDRLRADMARAEEVGLSRADSLWGMLRFIAKWRSQVLAGALLARNGSKVLGGPFAGMDYLSNPTEGALAPRLLGCYEGELHPYIAEFAAGGLEAVVDIGCAEGYYAVGLARLMPEVMVHAFDIDPAARAHCAELARRNGVAERVRIGELFQGERFADFGPRTLAIVDIEGAEADLLDPDRYPGLHRLSLIVETHPGARPGVTELLISRFSPSHEVIRVDHALTPYAPPEWLARGPHIDLALAAWEWRAKATPWLVMRPKRPDAGAAA